MERVRIFEVGARDGLQNEPTLVSTSTKLWFMEALYDSGLKEIEVGAFVRPDRIPQMADSEKIIESIKRKKIHLPLKNSWVLVPNERGLDRALDSGVKSIAVFTAASDGFAKANIGMTVKESISVQKKVIQRALAEKMRVRGYVSTVFGCPFDGKIKASQAMRVTEALLSAGVEEVSLGDTIGVATPREVEAVLKKAEQKGYLDQLAVHFHDTRGTALANALFSYQMGVRVFDSSAGGLGGCPFAPGATGNLATEDLIYLFEGMGIKTGVHLERLCETSLKMAKKMKRSISSKYLQAYWSQQKKRK
ncbi:MAG: hydroxymethylglutaryl-CoA lyase [Bdellovibrionaceae bacterium]|nr:hydroxymethylglutaryl-CoA lyase [Pseudobdellovibrionaceae bacterium]